jgi:uncharacterized caspase-like protein
MPYIKEGHVHKTEVAKQTRVNESNMYKATNNDINKPLAHYWDGVKHPETREQLQSDFELHNKNNECVYAQFRDQNDNTYYYIKDDEKMVDEQVQEDREQLHEIEQDRRNR